jgi:aromatic-L-amino-acid/L-tryptophan decarboxylase
VEADRADPEAAAAVSFRDDLAATSEWVASYLEGVDGRPVVPGVRPGEVLARLPFSPPDRPEPFADVLRDLDELIVPALTQWNHPRFFAFFANTGSEPGILAELLIAALNVNAMAWATSPAATELEQITLDWLAQLLGLPSGLHGHIEDSASTSTLAALAAARALRPGGAVYASEHAHFSVEKAARILGLELRKVPVDDEFRMLPDFRLDGATAVAATVGTTSSTSVDPVGLLAERCEEAGVWLHVDAAYAGSAWVCPELRWSLEGVDRADSIVVNPHKWLFTPVDCSALWTRRPEALRAAFAAHADYLAYTDGAVDFRDHGPALGRRFRALKLWAVLRCYGREGLQALIREHVRLAALFETWVRDEPGWEISAPRQFSTVCFRHRQRDNDELARRATETGRIFVATTKLRGESVIRLAIGNERTHEDDVRIAWEVIRECAR